MKPGDRVVCIWGGPWYDGNLRVPSGMTFPRKHGVYTVRDFRFFDTENVWGLYLEEIVNRPTMAVGIDTPVEMPFSPSYFRPLVQYLLEATNAESSPREKEKT